MPEWYVASIWPETFGSHYTNLNGMRTFRIMEVSAGVVLIRKENGVNLFLLLQYPSGHWDFIKGHKENGETDIQTAIRESEEETGIRDIQFLDGFAERIQYVYKNRHRLIHKRVVFLLGITNTAEVSLSDEHLEFLWTDYEQSVQQVTFGNARRVLSRAQEFLRERNML